MSLRLEAVSPDLFELLDRLMQAEELENFALGGGTSLALRFGHRVSIDIDLFAQSEFDAAALADFLKGSFGMTESAVSKNSLSGAIGEVKVDVLAHRYPLVSPVVVSGVIRMLSLEDVAAMKLNAIANRGSKKDFWDYAELLKHFSRDEMLAFYAAKYPRDSLWNVEKSLSYFEDAESQPPPRDLSGRSWEEIKRTIRELNLL